MELSVEPRPKSEILSVANPNPVILNTVSQIDTVLVNFFITESQYLEVARFRAQNEGGDQKGRRVHLRADSG